MNEIFRPSTESFRQDPEKNFQQVFSRLEGLNVPHIESLIGRPLRAQRNLLPVSIKVVDGPIGGTVYRVILTVRPELMDQQEAIVDLSIMPGQPFLGPYQPRFKRMVITSRRPISQDRLAVVRLVWKGGEEGEETYNRLFLNKVGVSNVFPYQLKPSETSRYHTVAFDDASKYEPDLTAWNDNMFAWVDKSDWEHNRKELETKTLHWLKEKEDNLFALGVNFADGQSLGVISDDPYQPLNRNNIKSPSIPTDQRYLEAPLVIEVN